MKDRVFFLINKPNFITKLLQKTLNFYFYYNFN